MKRVSDGEDAGQRRQGCGSARRWVRVSAAMGAGQLRRWMQVSDGERMPGAATAGAFDGGGCGSIIVIGGSAEAPAAVVLKYWRR
ncbi:unnamed protein product [Cuscuta campestris]|uniref:Uncharacterized protein n=1 Tax=Cuscuta campestris TaxID=132261 RepID=A0A484MER5_9ASTE|nr:unnamed protein product [Cuscuta campestris]